MTVDCCKLWTFLMHGTDMTISNLNWAGLLKSLLVNAHEEFPLEVVVLEVVALRLCDILHQRPQALFPAGLVP